MGQDMGQSELEVEVTLASANDRRRVWISAQPDVRPGRRMRFEHPSEPHRWWRITEVGQIRLRAPIDDRPIHYGRAS